MTERLFEGEQFWEELYPQDEDRRARVKKLVLNLVTLDNLDKIYLTRHRSGVERLNLIRPDKSIVGNDGDKRANFLNDSFSDTGLEFKDWPWIFNHTEQEFLAKTASRKSKGIEQVLVWERQEAATQV